jgi:Zn-dependent peptidase ImmA (M78 family)
VRAEEKASEVLARYAFSVPVDVERIVEVEGLEVVERNFPSVEEVYLYPSIGMKRGLPRVWRRWVIAHALGHYFMHRGNQLWFRRKDDVLRRQQETQAERFAAYLLIPQAELGRLRSLDLWDFAEHFEVPPECIALRFPK